MAALPHSSGSLPRPSRAGFKAGGFPPPPKSVRLWNVLSAETVDMAGELNSHLPAASSTGRAFDSRSQHRKFHSSGYPVWLFAVAGLATVSLVITAGCLLFRIAGQAGISGGVQPVDHTGR
jgi:hypothetical protein